MRISDGILTYYTYLLGPPHNILSDPFLTCFEFGGCKSSATHIILVGHARLPLCCCTLLLAAVAVHSSSTCLRCCFSLVQKHLLYLSLLFALSQLIHMASPRSPWHSNRTSKLQEEANVGWRRVVTLVPKPPKPRDRDQHLSPQPRILLHSRVAATAFLP